MDKNVSDWTSTYGSFHNSHGDLPLRNSKHLSKSYFRYSSWRGPFSVLTSWPLTSLASTVDDIRSHTVIPQEYKNTHQSFGAPSSFDRQEESSPSLLNALLAKLLFLYCLRCREQNCILWQFKAEQAEKGGQQRPGTASLIHRVHTVTVNSKMILKIFLQVKRHKMWLFHRPVSLTAEEAYSLSSAFNPE